MHSFMLLRHGQVVAEGWWAPYSAERPIAVLAQQDRSRPPRRPSPRPRVCWTSTTRSSRTSPSSTRTSPIPRSRSMQIRHIAAMASGHEQETLAEAFALDPDEPVRGFLLIPPDRQPGTVFAYNQPCTYALGSIVQRNAGMPLTRYLRPRLFDPLGIGHGRLAHLPARPRAGLHRAARPDRGHRQARAAVPAARPVGRRPVDPREMGGRGHVASRSTTPTEPNPDWRQGYGFQFWMSRHGYRGDGAFGQFCVSCPNRTRSWSPPPHA